MARCFRFVMAALPMLTLLSAGTAWAKNTVLATAPHPPVSFSYGGSSWCELGALRHDNRPTGFAKCEGSFFGQGDNWTTATTAEGETTYADEHGLRAQVSWKHYTNATLGVAGSREWAVEFRYIGNATTSSLPVCGPDDNFSPAPPPAPPVPPLPPAVCPAPRDVRVGQCIQGYDLTNCKPAPPAPGRSSITPTGCSSTHPSWETNSTLGFEACMRACCDNPACVAGYYEQKSQMDGFGHCTTGKPCCWLKSSNTAWAPRPEAEEAKTGVVRQHGAPVPPPPGPPAGPVLIDLTLAVDSNTTAVILHRQHGSVAGPTDFSAIDSALAPGDTVSIAVGGGRSSEGDLPLWNIEIEKQGGVVVALGWSGNWKATVTRAENGKSVRLTVAPGTLCATLHAGETVYLGRALEVPWSGEDYRLGYVLLRRLMAAYKVPRLADGTLPHFLATESYDRWPESDPQWGTDGVRNESNAHWVQELAAKGGLDSYWMDANWFHSPGGLDVGNWRLPLSEVENSLAFPSGIRSLFDHARSHTAPDGKPMRVIMWTEPERVSPGSWIHTAYPQYVYEPDAAGATTVVNLGDPDALRYLQQFVNAAVDKYQLNVWRVDFNTNPAVVWARTGDAHSLPVNKTATEFRRGINEAGYVRGLYELWDSVRHRHPGLIIDNCASGGRRHDLETMSRSIPLWPSDYSCGGNEDLGAMQSMTMGLSRWLPSHGGAYLGVDP